MPTRRLLSVLIAGPGVLIAAAALPTASTLAQVTAARQNLAKVRGVKLP